jgi:hypothetical protein
MAKQTLLASVQKCWGRCCWDISPDLLRPAPCTAYLRSAFLITQQLVILPQLANLQHCSVHTAAAQQSESHDCGHGITWAELSFCNTPYEIS